MLKNNPFSSKAMHFNVKQAFKTGDHEFILKHEEKVANYLISRLYGIEQIKRYFAWVREACSSLDESKKSEDIK